MRNLAAIGGLVVMLGACGSQTPPSSSSGGNTAIAGGAAASATSSGASVGNPVHVTGKHNMSADITVLSVSHHSRGATDAVKAPTNGQYAVVDVRIQVRSGSYPFSSDYFEYQTQGGATYTPRDANPGSAGFVPQLYSGTLSAGQTVDGLITFDVPVGPARDIQLHDPVASITAQWNVP
jgi:hypothetical protein